MNNFGYNLIFFYSFFDQLCFSQASLNRGGLFNLKSNTDNDNWEVQSNDGTIKTFPGVCFMIPPPDPDAINRVDL